MAAIQVDERTLEAAAASIGLHVPAELKPGVLRFLQLAAGMADRVLAFPLEPGDEPGSVWHPVEPRE